MSSLIVPFSIIVATLISIIYYQLTNNMIVSLLIGLIGPLIIHIILQFILKAWAKATNTEIRPNFLSRLGGSILTLVWGWVFITFTLILLAAFPPWGKLMAAIHNDVTKSASYFCIAKPVAEHFLIAPKSDVTPVTKPPSGSDVKSLSEDPRFQEVLKDPDIQKEIDNRDLVHLMSNPKIRDLTQEILSDPAALKKVMAVYTSQTQPPQNAVTTESYK